VSVQSTPPVDRAGFEEEALSYDHVAEVDISRLKPKRIMRGPRRASRSSGHVIS